ncbi:hypothetical protein LZ31DRAFT_560639 [Colletotrichum somersetense]|nr:hypothetical protein LZ31DRAFT_560639 [Colletotrichum somersetense]
MARLDHLPVEVTVQIFCLLPDFPALFSTIETCRRLRIVYQSSQRRILSSVLRSAFGNAPSGSFTLISHMRATSGSCTGPYHDAF